MGPFRDADLELRRSWQIEAAAYRAGADPRAVAIFGWRLGRIAATVAGVCAIATPAAIGLIPLAAVLGGLTARLCVRVALARRTRATKNVHADLDRLVEPPTEIVLRGAWAIGFWSFVPPMALSFYGWGALVSHVFDHPPYTLAGALLVMSPFVLLYAWIFLVAYETYTLRGHSWRWARSSSTTLTTGPSRQSATGIGAPALQRAPGP